jgi:hypothetical protein
LPDALQDQRDVFLSYRRAANATADRWVDAFCDELRASLNELLGREVRVWRDVDQITGGDAWAVRLRQAVDSTAIFVALFSRSYMLSDQCRRELDEFLGCLKERRDDRRKLVPVFKQPSSPDAPPPPEVEALQRHEFYRWSPPGSPHWRELTPGAAGEEQREFYATLGRLAQDIALALEDIDRTLTVKSQGTVFLARVPPELEQHRERLRADLCQRRYLVLPRNEYLWNADGLDEALADDLSKALLCVHLVSPLKSIDPDAPAHSRLQLERAHAAMKSFVRPAPLVWIQPGKADAPDTQALLDTITSELANDGVEYVRGSLEDFKTQAFEMLAALALPAARSLPKEVVLLIEEGDIGIDATLRAVLADRLAVSPRQVKFIGSAPKDAQRLALALGDCQHVLLVWAAQPQEWLDDVIRLPALAGHRGRDHLAVVMAGPASAEKRVFRTPEATVFEGEGAGLEAALQHFFGGLPS